ncbi:mitochondrial carrier [Aulographum hederae CBS 113979]|uniref:Mitochondrial carrier n=1 Tax=Aulographum hederae CBS 113979 TaxID=1176131 RepID=A0A6G1GYC7_9PEZI|nr:mitochondrial carrier [Aulographum hederae CBS 113979]
MATKSDQRQPFWLGGAAASMAACFTHPLDQTKYRMQVQVSRASTIRSLSLFAARDGITSLWQGLSASVLRQSTYSTARFGLYNFFAQRLKQATGAAKLSTSSTIWCAGVAGGVAGVLGNPTEVVLVRMCADGAKPPAERFGYKNAVDGMIRIAKEDGLATFSRGLVPNVVRSVLMNVSQIATYAAAKTQMLSMPGLGLKDDMTTHAMSSLIAGTVTTAVCAPADVVKSRLQSAAKSQQQTFVKIILEPLRKEGPLFLMKGFSAAWIRLTPHTMLTFMFMEQLRNLATGKRKTE